MPQREFQPVQTRRYTSRERLAVVMSVYNAERYLRPAVESILTQTFAEFVFNIIDDGSTDSSLAILREYAKCDARIRLVSRARIGLVGALNEALGMADTEYVARMDADDISRPERFKKQIEFLDEQPDFVAVGCHCLWVDRDGLAIKVMPQPTAAEAIDAALLSGRGNAITHAASMYRRTTLEVIGGYRHQFETAEDLDLFLRLAEHGKLANLADVLYIYRQHHASTNHSQFDKQEAAKRFAVEEACKRRSLPVSSTTYVPWASRPRTRTSLYHHWVVLAREGGNLRTARKYARRLLIAQPFSKASWRQTARCYLPEWIWKWWCKARKPTDDCQANRADCCASANN